MGKLTIRIEVDADPDENVRTHVQGDGLAESEIRPSLDRAILALQAEREALEDCPYHRGRT